MRAILLCLLLTLPAFAGCSLLEEDTPEGYTCRQYLIFLRDLKVESRTEETVTYRFEIDAGVDGAGHNVTVAGVNNGTRVDEQTILLDPAGKATVRITVPASWNHGVILVSDGDEEGVCGSGTAGIDPSTATGLPGELANPPPTTTPTPEPPVSQPPEECRTYVEAIETDREHYAGESDAIYRVRVAGDVPDGTKVRGTVDGTPITGEVVDGVAELRHRVYQYGAYTVTNIAIDAPDCPHDPEQDKVTSATADVS